MMKVLGTACAVFLTLGLVTPSPVQAVRNTDTPAVSPAFAYSVETLPELSSTEHALGIPTAAISIYSPFDQPFPSEWGQEAVQRSVPLVIAWEPWDWHLTPSDPLQRQYSLRSIANGAHDDYMRAWARSVSALNVPVLIRFAPEMNGDWTAWAGQRPDNSPEDFKNAWNHAQTIFRTENVHNARWIFNPSVVEGESIPMERYYPGSEQVDWLAYKRL